MPESRPTPLDLAGVDDVVDRVLTASQRAVAAARDAAAPVAAAADLLAGRFAAGGRLFLAAADPVADRVLALVTADLETEFGLAAGSVVRDADERASTPNPRDAVLVASTGGGADGFLAAVRQRGAGTALVTTGPRAEADVVVGLTVDPEPVDGFSRLGAATALKAVLDALVTAVVAQLGRVHDDLPVDLVATTDADRERVVSMVERLAGVGRDEADRAAHAAGHDVRIAVLTLAGGLDPARASTLAANRRTLRDALANLPHRPPEPPPEPPPHGSAPR